MTARSERSPAAPPPRRPPPRGPPREGKQEGRRGRAPRGIRAPRPQPAARPGWHHAARALRPPAHAPLAARVGAAVPSPRPPHHGPQGKCAPGRAPTCGGNLRSPAHIPRGGGRGKGGVRLRAPSPPAPTTQSPRASGRIQISPVLPPPPSFLAAPTLPPAFPLNCHCWVFFPRLFSQSGSERVPPASEKGSLSAPVGCPVVSHCARSGSRSAGVLGRRRGAALPPEF